MRQRAGVVGAIRAGGRCRANSSASGLRGSCGSKPSRGVERSLGPYQTTAPTGAGSVGVRARSEARCRRGSPHTTVRPVSMPSSADRSASHRSAGTEIVERGGEDGFAAEPVVDAGHREACGREAFEGSWGPVAHPQAHVLASPAAPGAAVHAQQQRDGAAQAGPGEPQVQFDRAAALDVPVRHAAQQADSGFTRGSGRQGRDVRVGRRYHLAQGGPGARHRVRHWWSGRKRTSYSCGTVPNFSVRG